MLKTQTRPSQFTGRLDRAVVERTKFSSNPTQQYLDVALARGSADLNESRSKVNNKPGKYSVKGLPNVDNKKPAPKASVVATVNRNVGRSVAVAGGDRRGGGAPKLETAGKSGHTSKADAKITAATFKEKSKFESQKNQKLYQELDEMLTGKNNVGYPLIQRKPKQEPAPTTKPTQTPRRDKVTLVTKDSLYPKISHDIKEKTPDSYNGRPVPPLQKTASIALESETWHARELRAKQRLQQLDTIDSFRQGDFRKRTKIFDDKSIEQRQSFGVPIHTVNTTGRRHIIADIPIYVPKYGSGNPSDQTVITNTQAVPVDRVFQTTVPNTQPGVGTGKVTHAPEGIHASQSKVPIKTEAAGVPNSVYRDPVTERLQLEKAERERARMEKENIQYFDIDPTGESSVTQARNLPPSVNNREDHKDKTLLSDPGPGRNLRLSFEGLEDLKYSPEGYLAEKRRQHRLEKEARMHQRFNANSDRENRRDETFGGNSYRNSYSYREHGEYSRPDMGRSDQQKPDIPRRAFDRENSWTRDAVNRSYRKSDVGYGGNMYKIPPKMDPRALSPRMERDDLGRDTNRSYQILSEIKDRDRYSDRNTYRSIAEDGERSRRSNDVEMQQTYADHLAREREAKEGPFHKTDDSPNYRSRYKESSEYPRGTGYLQDSIYRNANDTNDRGQIRERRNDPSMDMGGYGKRITDERKDVNNRSDSASRKTREGEKKVQYVMRNKSGLSKSQLSPRSGSLPENIPPPSTEMVKRSDRNSQSDAKSIGTVEEIRMNPQTLPRQDPIGSERTKAPVQEGREQMAKPSSTHKIPVPAGAKEHDDLDKFFDDAEDPSDPSNRIPFYSDNVSRYSRQKNDLRNGDIMTMTPVQEMSVKQSEEEQPNLKGSNSEEKDKNIDLDSEIVDPYARPDRKEGRYIGRHQSNILDNSTPQLDLLKKKFPSSETNKHYIEEDRKSPWKKEKSEAVDIPDDKIAGRPEGPDFSSVGKHSGRRRGDVGESSVEYIKERIREKTLEKMRDRNREKSVNSAENMFKRAKERSDGNMFRKSKEKTMDSQGPDMDDKQDMSANNKEKEDVLDSIDDIETELDERELYVCYLQTDNGETIGPLRLDIDDVQLGLPKPLDTNEQEQDNDPEGKEYKIEELKRKNDNKEIMMTSRYTEKKMKLNILMTYVREIMFIVLNFFFRDILFFIKVIKKFLFIPLPHNDAF